MLDMETQKEAERSEVSEPSQKAELEPTGPTFPVVPTLCHNECERSEITSKVGGQIDPGPKHRLLLYGLI